LADQCTRLGVFMKHCGGQIGTAAGKPPERSRNKPHSGTSCSADGRVGMVSGPFALAHTADDQAETLRDAFGAGRAGVDGLSGHALPSLHRHGNAVTGLVGRTVGCMICAVSFSGSRDRVGRKIEQHDGTTSLRGGRPHPARGAHLSY